MCSRYLIVTDGQTDRRTDGQTDGRLTVASPRSALASRGNYHIYAANISYIIWYSDLCSIPFIHCGLKMYLFT